MSLIVSDNSPLNLLVRLGLAHALPELFDEVLIPPEVANEMRHPKAPQAVRDFLVAPPAWLRIRSPQTMLFLPQLDAGEAAAISLAVEISSPLLIDEQDGRAAALARGLEIVGAIGVLERAANEGLIADLRQVHQTIRTLRFHVADDILDRSLARHLAHGKAGGSPPSGVP